MIRKLLATGVCTAILGASATQAQAQPGRQAGNDGMAARPSLDLLPLLDVRRGDAGRTNVLGADHRSPVGGYVRFWVQRVVDRDSDPRFYSSERRTWLQRFFIGRSRTRLLTARLLVNRSQLITQTVTLAAASHDSNRRQGENWSTELGDRRFLTPYFRVEPGTTASVQVALSASATVDSDITRSVLAVVEQGARLTAPSGPLVTSLTSSRLTESANFIDSSISRLFGQALAERSQSDFAAEGWDSSTTAPLATIRALFPMGSHIWSEAESNAIGEWEVRVSNPIVSIFSVIPLHGEENRPLTPGGAAQPCDSAGTQSNAPGKGEVAPERLSGHDRQACLAFTGLGPSTVLGLPVGENLTLGQALRADAGITASLQRYENAANKSVAARETCGLVAERAEVLGLNTYDAAAAVWAFASTGGFSDTLARELWNNSQCAAANLAKRLRLTLNMASADQPHPVPADPGTETADRTVEPGGETTEGDPDE